MQVNFDTGPLGFIQIPEARMRSNTCRFHYIFTIETRSCYPVYYMSMPFRNSTTIIICPTKQTYLRCIQSLRAVSCPDKKLEHISENFRGGSSFDRVLC